jgi:hypothetical protein
MSGSEVTISECPQLNLTMDVDLKVAEFNTQKKM